MYGGDKLWNGIVYGLSDATSIFISGGIVQVCQPLSLMKFSFLAFIGVQPLFELLTSDMEQALLQSLKVLLVGFIYNGTFILQEKYSDPSTVAASFELIFCTASLLNFIVPYVAASSVNSQTLYIGMFGLLGFFLCHFFGRRVSGW